MKHPPESTNVATLLTPPGVAAIAVICLAGPRVRSFLAAHFSIAVPSGRCAHGILRDEVGNEIDDPVVAFSGDGTVADVNVHGGTWVVRAVLQLAERAGFSVGGASEARTICCDAGNELDREVLASLPLARTELALRSLLAQPEAWATVTASSEAAALDATSADRSLTHLLHPPRVAIVGAPNVGKSTLANQLFAQQRSITADVPGTTRDWVGEVANIDGLAVTLVDTPGVRETLDAVEREAIDRSRIEVERADLVLLVLDAGRSALSGEASLRVRGAIKVINKIDLASPRPEEAGAIGTVATTGRGVDTLRDAIRRHFGCLDVPANRPRVWTERQREIVTRAIDDPEILKELWLSKG